MNFLSTLLNLFGTKSGRDMKELSPIIAKVSEQTDDISKLSNDELRHKTIEFKSKINIIIEDFEHRVNQLRDNVKKHNKKKKEKKGGIISKENYIHLSNLALVKSKKKEMVKK